MILKEGNAHLQEKSVTVSVADPEQYIQVINLLEKAYEKVGRTQGLAAPQIGYNVSIVICRLKGKATLMINPTILKTVGAKTSLEGCESVKERWYVKRPRFGLVQYYDLEAKHHVKRWYGFKSIRVIQHECDHLDGVLISMKGGIKAHEKKDIAGRPYYVKLR